MSHIQVSDKLGMKYGGVWKDFHEKIQLAEANKERAEKLLSEVTKQRDELQIQKDDLLYKFRDSVASLTDYETNHMEAKQILERVRHEKKELVSRCLSLETQRDWLEKQNKEHRLITAELNTALVQCNDRVKELEQRLSDEQKETKTLGGIVYKRDEGIEVYQNQLKIKKEELLVLHKSLSTKDKQFQALLKERNRLRDEVDSSQKLLRKYSNLSVHKLADNMDDDEDAVPLRNDSSAVITPVKQPLATDSEQEKVNPYADLFSDILPQATQASGNCDGTTESGSKPRASSSGSKSTRQFTGANAFDLRDRQHSAVVGRYQEELRLAREEIAQLRDRLGSNAQQRSKSAGRQRGGESYAGAGAARPQSHQMVATPPKLTRRVVAVVTPSSAFNSSPTAVTANSAEKQQQPVSKPVKLFAASPVTNLPSPPHKQQQTVVRMVSNRHLTEY